MAMRIIDENLVQTLIDYLAGQPFREVHDKIGFLVNLSRVEPKKEVLKGEDSKPHAPGPGPTKE